MAALQPEGIQLAPFGQKRGPGRPPKSGLPPQKKVKRDSSLAEELTTITKIARDGTPAYKKQRSVPSKLVDTRPLPTLPEPQPLNLPSTEYASIAASGVLSRSLDVSRISWTQKGVFERYWVKPETGKNAKPPPPNNPDIKSMKGRGRCRIRIEPHIFEVEVYVVEKPRVPAASKHYLPPARPPGYQQTWRTQPHQTHPTGAPSTAVRTDTTTQSQDKKTTSDPVIGLLAQRAGSDPGLKKLMREVAAGNAPPEQLRIFQQHIDELNTVLQTQMQTQDQESKPPDSTSGTTAAQPYAAPQKHVPPAQPEVVFAFTTPGAGPDRFLFPQHCIVEALTRQHLLTSFIVTRKGSQVSNNADLDSSKNYWSPVTIMIEVAYGYEGILSDIRRWIKSPEETSEHMRTVMSTHERVPEAHLALRLPLKGSAAESANTSKVGTPIPQTIEDKKRRQSKDAKTALASQKQSAAPGAKAQVMSAKSSASQSQTSSALVPGDISVSQQKNEVEAQPTVTQRSGRVTRKSSRLSEL